ncbi:ASST-domain-containing protein [Aspergillus caelatus]|uniref:ASST-domain-containing protein n=1 Tax=Aspergillus caelatus TaxID=61420 RepID=A0A5N7AMH1_9EURO|nr:ASST-domain-containing protein [Aspergillus caelatus]KAE8370903.1 ASST-domain-containing protein [Aspergillus caelatus]
MMGSLTQYSLLLAAAAGLPFSSADGHYRSRPDLTVPKLNITVPAPDANGTDYVFVAPYANTIQQPGAYIYRKDGDLVWSGIGYYAGFVGNFHPTTYNGRTVLQAFQGSMDQNHGEGVGQHVLLDQNYEHVISTKTGNHHIPSIHEFTVVNGETALVEIYLPTIANLTQYGGNSSQQWLGNGLFQEFDIATGELVFEWNSLDYLDPADSLNPLGATASNSGLSSAQTWDYVHINSIDKDDDGNYLVSSRHFSTIFKINGTDGSIIWQLGGNHSTFTQDFTFGFQHDARWRSQSGNIDVISFFDNSGNGEITFNNVSRALFIQLNHTDSTATVLRKATAPYELEANSQGNTQLLPNDNLFVSWGSAGAFTQFDANNEILYHAFIEDAVSYRGFVANWTGTPSEAPALAAYVDSANTTRLYVSWNGDTETKIWKFYQVQEGDSHNEVQYLGEQSRKSFETTFFWESGYRLANDVKFYAEAIGGNGDVLVRTLPSVAASFIDIAE